MHGVGLQGPLNKVGQMEYIQVAQKGHGLILGIYGMIFEFYLDAQLGQICAKNCKASYLNNPGPPQVL